MMASMLVGLLSTAAATVLLAVSAPAQEAPKVPEMTPEQQAEMEVYMKAATPGAPHRMLASRVGSYDLKIKSWAEPGGPPVEESGTAKRTMILGGRVLVEDVTSTMMGEPYTGHGMTGYDNVTGKYWSIWMDTMGTGMMVSEGTCDAQEVCSYKGSWNDPVRKGPVEARTTTRWTSPTTEFFEMFGPDKNGKEMKMMEITYTKK
jgi:hypothetical protein